MILDSNHPKETITKLNICHSKLLMTDYKALPSSRILPENIRHSIWKLALESAPFFLSVLFKMAYNNSNNTNEVTKDYICNHSLLQVSTEYTIEFCSSNTQTYSFTTFRRKLLPCQILSMHFCLQKGICRKTLEGMSNV